MLNLCLHCGAHEVDRNEIAQAPTPGRTRTWVPIPHHTLLDQVEHTLAGNGFNVVNQAHSLWGDGNRYFGLLQISTCSQDGDYSLVVGLRNSHDKSFPAGLVLGASVFVCDNMSFSGESRSLAGTPGSSNGIFQGWFNEP